MYKDVARRILAGILTICMIAGMADLSAFTVAAAGNSFENDGDVNWHFEYDDIREYTGKQITQDDLQILPIETDGSYGAALVKDTDYTLSYGENLNTGLGTIHIEGINTYAGSIVDLDFIISKKNLNSGITVEPIPDQSYTGAAVVPSITVKHGAMVLKGVYADNAVHGASYDYVYSCQNNIAQGQATVRIEGKGNYEGTLSTTFNITQLDPTGLEVAPIGVKAYNGNEIKPEPEVTYNSGTGKTVLKKDTDYTLSYRNNVYAGTATVIITGRGAYSGIGTTAEFTIRKSLGHGSITVDPISNQVYTGSAITFSAADIIVHDGDKSDPLVAGTDYDIDTYLHNTNIGTGYVRIKGINAYSSTKLLEFQITPVTMNDVVVTVPDCVYNGEAQTPTVTVSRGDTEYDPSEYNVSYRDNINAGTGIVAVSGTGSLSGSVDKEFTIAKKPLADTEKDINMQIDYPENKKYTGSPIKPTVTVTHTLRNGTVKTLQENTDYTVNYENCINAGQATVKVTGRGNYTGERVQNYTIDRAPLDSAEIADITDRIYTGSPFSPGVRVTLNGTLLSRYNEITGTGDYTIEYMDNINAGQATVKITGCGNYSGEAAAHFTINKKELTSAGVTVRSIPAQVYNGSILKPEVTITYNTMTLTENDVVIEYGDETTNTNVGTNTGVVTITAKPDGNYTGEITKNFSITPRNIRTGDYLSLRNLEEVYTYTGTDITAADLEVYYNNPEAGINTMLLPDTEYKVTYSGNREIGTAVLTVTGNGNYTGSKDFSFKIKGDVAQAQVTIPNQVYAGSAITPANMEVRFNGVLLKKGTDYNVTCQNNIEPGEAEVVIEGINNYTGTKTEPFIITKKDLTTVTESDRNFVVSGIDVNGYEYNGFEIKPELTIFYNGTELVEGNDYNLSYSDNNHEGTASVTVTGIGAHFEGDLTRTFRINKYEIGQTNSNVALSGVVEDVVWDNVDTTDGVSMTPEGTIVQDNPIVTYHCTNPADAVTEDRELVEGIDYKVSYETNDKIGTAAIIITGTGDFTGTIRKEFAIHGDLANAVIEPIADWEYIPDTAEVPGYDNQPVPVVKYNGETLEAGTDYVVSYRDNGNVGTATVTVSTGTNGNYVNSTNTTFEIVPRKLTAADDKTPIENLTIEGLQADGYEYTGSEIVPQLTVKYCGVELTTADIEITAVNNVDVPISEDETQTAPQPTVTITAKTDGNYTGAISQTFIINPRPVSEDTIRVEGLEAGYEYTGSEITVPEDILKIYYKDEITPLVKDTENPDHPDYTITYTNNKEIGTATITFTGKNNYAGVLEKNFYVMGNLEEAEIDGGYITVADVEPVPYGIVPVYPKLVITDSSSGEEKILVQGKNEITTAADTENPEVPTESEGSAEPDFVITECINNVNVADIDSVNPPTVTIEGRGCYKGTITRKFEIVAKDLSTDEGDITASFEGSIEGNAFVYTGQPITPPVKIYNHGVEMALATAETPGDYIIREYVNNVEVPGADTPQESYPGVVIDAVENGNYVGSKTLYFKIIPKDISNMNLSIVDTQAQTFDRTEKKPEVQVTYQRGEETVVLEPENYTVTYQNNINAAAADAETAPTVTVTGKGNYGGTISKTFAIVQESIAGSNADIIATAQGGEYTGAAVTPIVEVTAADGTVLAEGTDYTLGECTGNVNAGTGYITINGAGNYSGNRQIPFTIAPKNVAAADITVETIPAQTYTGSLVAPKPTVKFKKDGETVGLTEGADYTVSYRNNINTGTAYAVIAGKGNYGGQKEVPFAIARKVIGINGTIDGEMILSPISDQLYTGKGVVPVVTLKYRNTAVNTTQNLVAGRDYKVSCTSNVSVGTATAVITGINNYSGTIRTTFRIQGNMVLSNVGAIPIQRYTGGAIQPQPIVTFAGKRLVKDTDYTLEYYQNVQRGTASIKIIGKDLYRGSKTVYFTIAGSFSEGLSVTGVASAYTYTGKYIMPSVRVEDYGRVLVRNRDYKVTYTNCKDVGTAALTITGIGEFVGSKRVTYKIVPRNIAQSAVSSISSQYYTGKKITPPVKVVNGGHILKAGTDYTIVYVNNVRPGKASVIIKGKSNFIGTKTLNFNIVIPKVGGLKQSKASSKTVTLSWKRNSTVTGYEIYNYSNKRVARLKNSQTSYTISGLKGNKSYGFKVRAYVIKNGVTRRGSFVTIKTTTTPSATKITSISSSKSKQVVLKWKKISGATDYVVYRSTSKNGKYSSIGTTKSTYYTDKKATGGKTYYYKIRVRKNLNRKNYYSSSSNAVGKRAKK